MDDLTEEKARQMEAGPELNRVCAEWVGWSYFAGMGSHQWKLEAPGSTRPIIHQGKDPPPFSSDWSAAGPLLEAMNGTASTHDKNFGDINSQCYVPVEPEWMTLYTYAPKDRPQLAIARACAVLVARGVSRDDLEVTR